MAEPEKDFEKLRKEQEKEDAGLLAELDKEVKLFDKVRSYAMISLSVTVVIYIVGLRD